jgi:DNA adenine methylase
VVTVLTRDAFELIPKIEDVEGVTVYCDPPYFSKTVQYVHDFTDPAAGSVDKAGKPLRNPHVVLAEMLGRFQRTRVVVSYYDHPRLAELYPVERWRRVQLVAPKFSANATNKPLQGGKRAAKVAAPELLLINQKA